MSKGERAALIKLRWGVSRQSATHGTFLFPISYRMDFACLKVDQLLPCFFKFFCLQMHSQRHCFANIYFCSLGSWSRHCPIGGQLSRWKMPLNGFTAKLKLFRLKRCQHYSSSNTAHSLMMAASVCQQYINTHCSCTEGFLPWGVLLIYADKKNQEVVGRSSRGHLSVCRIEGLVRNELQGWDWRKMRRAPWHLLGCLMESCWRASTRIHIAGRKK